VVGCYHIGDARKHIVSMIQELIVLLVDHYVSISSVCHVELGALLFETIETNSSK